MKLTSKAFFICLTCTLAYCSQPENRESASIKPVLTEIATPHQVGANLPYLTIDKNGDLLHSWVEKTSDTTILKFATFSNDQWSTPVEIAQGDDWFVNWADYPMIAATQQGRMAHFLAKSASGTYSYDVNLLTQKKSDWSKSFIPHTDGTPTEHGFVTMLPLTDSTFQVAWLDGRNTGGDSHDNHGHGAGAMTLRTAVIGLDGTISEEFELDNRTCDCCQTGGAITSKGPVFVYRDRSELEIRDIYVTRKVNGEWSYPSPIAQDNWNIAGCPVNGPRADAIDNVLGVAWFTAAKGQPQVKVIFSNDAGENFGQSITLDQSMPLGRVDLVMLNKQSAMVSWLTQNNGETIIKAQKVFTNGSTEAPVVISKTSESRGSGFPQMAKVNQEVFFAWTSLASDSTNIKMAKITL
ncbi:hypothetical protein [Marinoscillum pacificum]|uniref:hypothetical protein n=1 Tax=Marinoscillum pacificum TaxID=392723 RepID=UPI002157C995|nr:hypothetical protein [Marinoscillum pacificum]